jgi:hypothetical protein
MDQTGTAFHLGDERVPVCRIDKRLPIESLQDCQVVLDCRGRALWIWFPPGRRGIIDRGHARTQVRDVSGREIWILHAPTVVKSDVIARFRSF